MSKIELIKLLDEKLKLIRTECGLTQDKMASVMENRRIYTFFSLKETEAVMKR